jgi:hypothetical protein
MAPVPVDPDQKPSAEYTDTAKELVNSSPGPSDSMVLQTPKNSTGDAAYTLAVGENDSRVGKLDTGSPVYDRSAVVALHPVGFCAMPSQRASVVARFPKLPVLSTLSE